MRTRDLAGTHVDVISYTTISSGFSLFTHNTHVGEVLTKNHPTLKNNIAPALIDQGRDCLQIMVDFGLPEIRDLAYQFVEEVCQNYDIDGLELGFLTPMGYIENYNGSLKQNEKK